MRIKFLLFALLIFQLGISQKAPNPVIDHTAIQKTTFGKMSFSLPLYWTEESQDLFVFDGFSSRIGFGKKLANWVSIGGNLGLDWKASRQIVVAPVFADLCFSVKIDSNETRLFIEPGYGKAFVIGRGDLSGNFRKISSGFEDKKGTRLYIEFCSYGFYKDGIHETGSVSVGVSFHL